MEESEQNKRVIDNMPYTYNPAIKGWVRDDTPATGLPAASTNLTTAQLGRLEMQELKTENERLKTDRTDNTTTPEKSANYAQGTQMLLNTPSITPSTKEAIREEM